MGQEEISRMSRLEDSAIHVRREGWRQTGVYSCMLSYTREACLRNLQSLFLFSQFRLDNHTNDFRIVFTGVFHWCAPFPV